MERLKLSIAREESNFHEYGISLEVRHNIGEANLAGIRETRTRKKKIIEDADVVTAGSRSIGLGENYLSSAFASARPGTKGDGRKTRTSPARRERGYARRNKVIKRSVHSYSAIFLANSTEEKKYIG